MTDKTSKEFNKAIGRAIYDEINRVPDHDEDFDYEEELGVIARDYPNDFDARKKVLSEEKTGIFESNLKKRDALIDELSDITPELVEKTITRIDKIDLKIMEIIEWFIHWDVDKTDNMKSFKTYGSRNKHLTAADIPSKEVKKPINNISKRDALDLLQKLEDPDYAVKDEDKNHFSNKNFKSYRSDYLKDRNEEYFKNAFKTLQDNSRLSHEEFLSITNCPSEWYKPYYIRSFTYHCDNINGRFFQKCKGKKFKFDSQYRGSTPTEFITKFTLI